MKILIACEFSGIVRDAFIEHGFDAISADLLPSESPGPHHQGNVLEILNTGFDMMIAFPPCTFLTYAAAHLFTDPVRVAKRIEAAAFFMALYNAPIKHIAIENPRGIMSKIFRTPDQEIHPWYFGEQQMKRTDLWLKNLPLLEYTLQTNLFEQATASEKPTPVKIHRQKATGKLKKRYWHDVDIIDGKTRSVFWPSIADAMAKQWGAFIKNAASSAPRFFVKPNFGHWLVCEKITGKIIIGYHKKEYATNTAEALNKIKSEKSLAKEAKLLQTDKGYGKYAKSSTTWQDLSKQD